MSTRPSTPPQQRYIAFLRGMNVGGRRIHMADLREHFTALGLANVETYIASGNVIFEATKKESIPALSKRIEQHLESTLGYAVQTFLRTPADLAAIVAHTPFPVADMVAPGHRVHVGFLGEPLTKVVARQLESTVTAMDALSGQGTEIYWLCRGPTTESLVSWPSVEKIVQQPMTMRNMNTVRKLAIKF